MDRILIVDDSPSCALINQRFLQEAGFSTETVHSGREGIDRLEQGGFDLVLMDVVMPELNGFQATREITRNPKTAHIPVVIVSTKGEDSDKVWGLRQGAVGYLEKPVNKERLLAEVRRALETKAA